MSDHAGPYDDGGEEFYPDSSELDAALGEGWQERWAAEDLAAEQHRAAAELAASEAAYAEQRAYQLFGDVLQEASDRGVDLASIDAAQVWHTANQLALDREFLAEHKGMDGGKLVAAACRAALEMHNVDGARDEVEAGQRIMNRRRAVGY
jgi:hypothetical protein